MPLPEWKSVQLHSYENIRSSSSSFKNTLKTVYKKNIFQISLPAYLP